MWISFSWINTALIEWNSWRQWQQYNTWKLLRCTKALVLLWNFSYGGQNQSRVNKIFSVKYCKVSSSSMFWLVAPFQIFRRLMKVKFDAYVLWPLAKKSQNWIVDWSTAGDFTVSCNGTELNESKHTGVLNCVKSKKYMLWHD